MHDKETEPINEEKFPEYFFLEETLMLYGETISAIHHIEGISKMIRC